MKKLFLLPFLFVVLTGCTASNSNGGTASNGPIETVTLNAENFSTYVATNSISTGRDDYYSMTYYTYFIGADNCKFIDCSVTYQYVVAGNTPTGTNGTTVPLTISGDGEAVPYSIRISGTTYTPYVLHVISSSGTVEVYR